MKPATGPNLARDTTQEALQQQVVETHRSPPDYLRYADREEASRLTGQPLSVGGWHFPSGGWGVPPSLCRANLARHPERIRSLIELSRSYVGVMYGSFLAILVTGIVNGFMGHWWSKGWIWVSIGILFAITFVMAFFGTMYFEKILAASSRSLSSKRSMGALRFFSLGPGH